MSNRPARSERSYHQWCPIAAGLDVLGDRWVLLICRELAIGDRRFTDLRNALPGIAPNLLTERLRALTDEGLVTTAELPPPAARTVYRLTEDGRRVLPVLRSLARFGARRLDPRPPARVEPLRVANALLLPWWECGGPDLRVRLDLGDAGTLDVVSGPGAVRLEASDPHVLPDVTLVTTPGALAMARRDRAPLVAEVRGPAAKRKAALAALSLRV